MATTSQSQSGPGGVFTRQSSGLVRTVSTLDTMFFSLAQIQVSFVMFNIAFWVFYPGANMELATIFSLIGSIGVGITYALFSAVYPRSGGEYVFLSRTTHPLLGFAASFINVFWQIFYWGVTAVFTADLALAPMFTALGLQLDNPTLFDIGSFFGSPTGWFIWGAATILLLGWLLYRGMAGYFRVQRTIMVLGLIGFVVFIIVLILGSAGALDFQANFNSIAGSGAYQQVIEAATAEGADLGSSFRMGPTLAFIIWPAFSFLFAVLSVSFSGEIKNVERGQLIAITGANILAGVLIMAVTFFARGAFGDMFIKASGYLSVVDPSKFPLPYVWTFILASVLGNNWILTIIINLSAALLITGGAAAAAIYSTRSILAWAIDGMAPERLADVNPNYHSPTYSILTVMVISLIQLALYCFTPLYAALSGLAPMALVFAFVPFAGMLFPYIHRETYEMSPVRIQVGGIPLMTITGFVGFVTTAFIVYRAVVDSNFGVNTPGSLAIFAAFVVVSVVWYYVARWYRRRQGVHFDDRFEEIPIE